MNKKLKNLGAAFLGLLMPFVVPALVHSADLTQLQVAETGRTQSAQSQIGVDIPMIRLFYVGTATEAVVTITTTAITAFAPNGTADTANFGVNLSSYVFASTSPYATIGGLCDAIEALPNYRCVMLGAKRSDHPSLLRDQTAAGSISASNLKSAAGVVIYSSSESSGSANGSAYEMRLGISPLNSDQRVRLKYCTVISSISATGTFSIYGKLREFEGSSDGITRNDSTLVYRRPLTTGTELSVPAAYPAAGWMSFAKGEHVVIAAGEPPNNMIQDSAKYLECQYDLVGP